MIQQGLELGGRKALSDAGRPVFRGQNIFAGGLKGDPTGRWAGNPAVIDNLRIYKYEPMFQPGAVFAGRKIAQLPTMVRLGQDEVTTNSCVVVALRRYLPIHHWILARPIQWFAAKTLRSNVIEDFGASWVTREFSRLPAPSTASKDDLDAMEACGARLIAADEDLFDSRRLVRASLEGVKGRPLQSRIVDGDPRTAGFGLNMTAEAGTMDAVRVEGNTVVVDGLFDMTVPDEDLRTYLSYLLQERLDDDEDDGDVSRDGLLSTMVPDELGPVVDAITRFREQRSVHDFEEAHRDLDRVVGQVLGLSVLETDYIAEQMKEDGFLCRVHPNYARRGFREQAYGGRPPAQDNGVPDKVGGSARKTGPATRKAKVHRNEA